MAEFLTITVHPSAQSGEDLTVHDAMQQVLDIIELLDRAGLSDGLQSPRVVWRLHSATTNSPFSVRAEGTSSDPTVSVALRAIQAKQVLARSLTSLVVESRRPEWMDVPTLRTTKRVLDRNLNGIGRTDIDTEVDAERVLIVPTVAQVGAKAIDTVLLENKYSLPNQEHTEFGSAEGAVIAAATYYNHPALYLKDRLTGDRVTCVLSDEAAKKIGLKESLSVVWEGQRVIVHGALHYSPDGRIAKIDAEDIDRISEEYVDLNEIRSLDITEGLPPIEYLNKIREEDYGEV